MHTLTGLIAARSIDPFTLSALVTHLKTHKANKYQTLFASLISSLETLTAVVFIQHQLNISNCEWDRRVYSRLSRAQRVCAQCAIEVFSICRFRRYRSIR